MTDSDLGESAPRPTRGVPPRRARRRRWMLLASWAVVALVAAPTVAWPQDAETEDPPSSRSARDRDSRRASKDDPFAGVEVMQVVGSGTAALLEAANPTSVLSFDAEDLQAIGASDVSDVAAYTPNLEIRTAGSTTAIFFIRGVGLSDFSPNAASSVAVYYDDVPVNAPALQLGQLFDIQDFSVLKGPQSGGAGRNASAGAIKVTSRQPGFDPAANLRVSAGRFLTVDAIDAFQYNVEGGIDVPMVDDVLTARLAFNVKGQDPFITNRCGGAPPFTGPRRPESFCGEDRGPLFGNRKPQIPVGLPTEVGEGLDWAARGIFKLVPPDTDGSLVLNVHGRKLDQDSTLGQSVGTGSTSEAFGTATGGGYIEPDQQRERLALIARGFNSIEAREILAKNLAEDRPLDKRPFDGDYNRVGKTRLETYGASLRAEFPVDDVTIRSITAFDGYERTRDTDTDFTPDILFESIWDENAWQIVQDLLVKGELDAFPLRWEVGGTYLHEDLTATLDQRTAAPASTNRDRFFRPFDQEIQSVAGFAKISLDFLEDFTLDAGARYNYEQKKFDATQFLPNAGPGSISGYQTRQSDFVRTWQAPSGAVSLTYRLTESVKVFWKYSRGFKSGHFNANDVDGDIAKPETIDAFELGFDGTFWAQRIKTSASFFSYAYQNYQVFIFEDSPGTNPVLEVLNADDARVYGVDAELVAEPLLAYVPEEVENLKLTLRFGWLESKFLRFVNLQDRLDTQGRAIQLVDDASGNQLLNSPEFKVSGTVDWKFLIGGMGSLTPRYDFTWTDDVFFDQSNGFGSLNGTGDRGGPQFRAGQPAYMLHNLRLTYRDPSEKVAVAGWCRNLADERYKRTAFDVSAFQKVVINFVGEPRSCGAEINFTW